MRLREIQDLVASTLDSSFAVDGEGLIVAWNKQAEAMFGLSAAEAIGRPCGTIVQGTDECGDVCSPNCSIRQQVRERQPVGNFDVQVLTAKGRQWCNVSILTADEARSTVPLLNSHSSTNRPPKETRACCPGFYCHRY